jgi:hypothetical protein
VRTFDWLVVIVMGVVGWLLVSFLLNRAKPQGNDSADGAAGRAADEANADAKADAEFPTMPRIPGPDNALPAGATRPGAAIAVLDSSTGSDLLSLDEIGRAWHSILGVSMDATGAQIESAYHAKLAAADRVRFDSNTSPANRRLAERQRAQVNQAYEFIRPSRS